MNKKLCCALFTVLITPLMISCYSNYNADFKVNGVQRYLEADGDENCSPIAGDTFTDEEKDNDEKLDIYFLVKSVENTTYDQDSGALVFRYTDPYGSCFSIQHGHLFILSITEKFGSSISGRFNGKLCNDQDCTMSLEITDGYFNSQNTK